MTVRLLGTPFESRDYLPLLRWLVLIALMAFGVVILTYFNLLQLMFRTDHTRISLLIIAIFLVTTAHCFYQTVAISRELTTARRIRDDILPSALGLHLVNGQVATLDGRVLPAGVLSRHIGNLLVKARNQAGRRLDQTLLLRTLADSLRAREKLGWFVSEALLRLALLGTAVGFILMLIPLAELNSFDVETLRTALSGMSAGMAIALNVTVTGLATALLLKTQYYFLDEAVGELFHMITEVTEVHVVSRLEGDANG